ncbi:MAG: peptidoglycan bridge formation glycyltransferase FemA/FemB family protein [Patescibacteria group bacterium]
MDLTIKYNLAKQTWDGFVSASAPDGGWLQSWAWGEFQQDWGRKIFRLAVFDGDVLAAVILLAKQEMPLGFCYLYAPRGPVIGRSADRSAVIDFLFLAVKKIAQAEQAIFFRLDPAWPAAPELIDRGFKLIGQVQPKSTLILDLNLSEAELSAQLKPKTRYNIKVAEKRGLKIVSSDKSEADFEVFWRLLQKTSKRDRIKSHQREYYLKMLKLPETQLVFARAGDRAVAANLMANFGAWSVYLHGASDYAFRDQMGPYLLQWQLIKAAKAAGCRFYDFWGVDSRKWPGVTRFKTGFAPSQPLTEYVGAYDFVYNKFFYRAYNLMKRFF